MTTKYLFSNNASTTLAQSISATTTVINVASGEGDLFPSPATGEAFAITFVDAATGLQNEIAYCTSRSGDALTVTRGQEGKTAQSWAAGDTVANFITADVIENWLQEEDLDGYATEAWVEAGFATSAELTAETSARESADTALQTNITNEATTRAAADSALQANITQETSARVAADALNAKLAGGNAFTGSQTIAGSVTATGGQLLATQSSDATMRALLYASSAVAQFALQSISGGTSSTLGYLNISSAGVVTTSLGTVALTSGLPSGGTITGGTYTKTPLNDGTGRSILRQIFHVTVTPDSSGNATISFPMSYSVIPNVVGMGSVEMTTGNAAGIVIQKNSAETGLATTTTNVPLHYWFGTGISTLTSITTLIVEGIA